MSFRKESSCSEQSLSGQIFHSVMDQFDDSKGELTPAITAHNTQCIADLLLVRIILQA